MCLRKGKAWTLELGELIFMSERSQSDVLGEAEEAELSRILQELQSVVIAESKSQHPREPVVLRLGDIAGTAYGVDEQRLTHEQRVRARALSLLGGKCVVCGEDDPTVLDIDHKLGGGTRERRAGRHHRKLWRALLNGTADTNLYQILCANCHRRKDAIKRNSAEDQEE